MRFLKFFLPLFVLFTSCRSPENSEVPVIGFVDAFEDATISQARTGFTDALAAHGFSEDSNTVRIIYRNAQGNIPTLTQIVKYFITEKVDLIATNPTLATITAAQNTRDIPICMMVSPTPARMNLEDAAGNPPENLFGVKEGLDYIDTSFTIISRLIKPKGPRLTVGMVYNQSEPQSVDALKRIKALADRMDIRVEAAPLNSSADAQLVTRSLLAKNLDAFFANPDNTVFASFETILKSCQARLVPVFTSEAGLVQRGAVAAFGADIYQWGYQAGEQAAQYLKTGSTKGLHPEMVRIRKRVFNPEAASQFGIRMPPDFEELSKRNAK